LDRKYLLFLTLMGSSGISSITTVRRPRMVCSNRITTASWLEKEREGNYEYSTVY
jgi:hypothetical protein